ncbi:MAG: hypothetical protein M0R66_03585 [Candidatus Omnitrophica bacterium]|nr:hypothetical protein [Candidatus Omnitrophota bacterium]
MSRDDISKYLIHWVKGDSYQEAFSSLRSIVFTKCLNGGTRNIKGGYKCVCFTEAPQEKFHQVIGRYKPFGVRVSKKWLYPEGGRSVIYQSDAEYELLHEDLKWRHVRYEPDKDPPIDFSWEREWRIKIEKLYLPPEEIVIILPDEEWAELLKKEHFYHEDERIYMDSIAYGDWAGYASPEPFHYAYSIIKV